ncbi:MAG: hypothetical protein IPM86_14165 [Saprospiraceae bacterium]|nr:hypothetical protein [Saprospiraceae bacterium]
MPKVEIPIQLRVLIKTGIDISLCPICKTGKLILIKTSICINGIFDRCPDHTKQRLSINKHRHSMKITLNKYCYTFTYRKINVDFSVAKLCKKLIIVLLKK